MQFVVSLAKFMFRSVLMGLFAAATVALCIRRCWLHARMMALDLPLNLDDD